ncbi:MAG: 4-hydroxy-tetrahydrodipicolinate synthase [Balneolales bacterium]|nr:4-hydroxy-tetrahydrodipicolinate synthase [Balneolales bacterium]
MKFEGLYTAIVTPFSKDESLDEPAFRHLLNLQIEGKVNGVVICGTTGEGPTVSDSEFVRLIRIAKEVGGGMYQVVAGTGLNSTQKTIERSEMAVKAGADALLVASPYYNKPTQEGLIRHFYAVADATSAPVMVYNVPGRTAVNIETETLLELCKHPLIQSVKEASGSIDQIMDVIAAVPTGFSVLAGDDAITLPAMAAGARGSVSVLSNQAPAMMKSLVNYALAGNFAKAREEHYRLLPLMRVNFMESNPIMVKNALSQMSLIENVLRLPMVPASEKASQKMNELLKVLNLLPKK